MKYKEYPTPTEPGWYWAQASWWDHPEIVNVIPDRHQGLEVLYAGEGGSVGLKEFTWYSERLPDLCAGEEVAVNYP